MRVHSSKTLEKGAKLNISCRPELLRSQLQSASRRVCIVVSVEFISAINYRVKRDNSVQCSFEQFDISDIHRRSTRIEMALIPRNIFRNWWDDMDRYHRELEEHFKRMSVGNDLWQPPAMPSFNEVFQPWRQRFEELEQQVGGVATVERDHDKYRVIVDVQQFAPEEITVRTDDKCITVEGKHEEKKDQHGYVSRQFVRRYVLPQGYDIGHVKPSLSSDGVLTITAPRLALPGPGERIVPIQKSNMPAIKAA